MSLIGVFLAPIKFVSLCVRFTKNTRKLSNLLGILKYTFDGYEVQRKIEYD